ncbi:hypothetical protein [Aliiroseovarius sp.]|uniref:hypothetical protein n=1 Tax=Aliiroseovarius sp. TaxID=1872442 RepID=UPI003BA9908B
MSSRAPQVVAFHPAPARAQRVYRLEASALQLDGDWSLDLTRVTRAAYVQHRVGDSLMRRLDLWQGETRRTIGWNGAAGSWIHDADAYAFLALCGATAGALQEVNPGLRITWGEYGRSRLALFVIGLLAVLAGLGIFAGALASGVSGGRLTGAALPMALLVLLGGGLALVNAPWRRLPTLEPAALPPILDAMAAQGREKAAS